MVRPPAQLWRVHRGDDPLLVHQARAGTRQHAGPGNRFDSPDGHFGVLYFATTLVGCFGEVLARLRPDPVLAQMVARDWKALGVMAPGQIPRDWRERRNASAVHLRGAQEFVDIDALVTHQVLRTELALGLAALGYQDLDISTVRGPDRRVTQMISQWAFAARTEQGQPRFAGLRYQSRLEDDWECWAVFADTDIEVEQIVPVSLQMSELQEVAQTFELTLH